MIFCKLLAGGLLVGGIAQASYCFDVTSLIKNQITDQTQTEKNMLPIKDAEITRRQKNITDKQQAIITVESEIEAKYKESEANLADSQKTGGFSRRKQSIPELQKSLAKEKELVEATEKTMKSMKDNIEKKRTILKQTQADSVDTSFSIGTRFSSKASALKQEAIMSFASKQLSGQEDAVKTAKENVVNTTETLNIETDLQVQRDKKNVLIYALQAAEELLEE